MTLDEGSLCFASKCIICYKLIDDCDWVNNWQMCNECWDDWMAMPGLEFSHEETPDES